MKELTEEFLYHHLPEAEEKRMDTFSDSPVPPHVFSETFEQKMKLLSGKQHHSNIKKVLLQTGKAAMLAVLLAAFLNTLLIFTVEAYRGSFFSFVQKINPLCQEIPGETDIPPCRSDAHVFGPCIRKEAEGEYCDEDHCYGPYKYTQVCQKCGHTVITRNLLLHDLKLVSVECHGSYDLWIYNCSVCGQKRCTEIHNCIVNPHTREHYYPA